MSGTLDAAPIRRYSSTSAARLCPRQRYDFNFAFDGKTLSSDRVELRPFVPLYEGLVTYPEVEKWLPRNMPKTLHEVLEFAESMRANSLSPAHLTSS
ncbi:hypothetical protein JCM24511_05298 [Saitozyma sp. JCM 24511]|nr:hypothetical protein JCM24511_05298 [Saitozyma sp. JCM 24511]